MTRAPLDPCKYPNIPSLVRYTYMFPINTHIPRDTKWWLDIPVYIRIYPNLDQARC